MFAVQQLWCSLTLKSFEVPSGESLATAKFSAVSLQISSPTF